MSKREAPPEGVDDDFDGFDDEGEAADPLTVPLAVSRSLVDILGARGETVEQVWVSLLNSDSERSRLEAAKVLTQASVALSKKGSGEGAGVPFPKNSEEVSKLTLAECFAILAAKYLTEIEELRKHYDDDEVVRHFCQRHDLDVALELLRRVPA